MPSNFPRYALAALVATISSTGAITAASAQEKSYDVVVYGGTSGGVVAAVQAARMGKTAVVIEPSKHIGGLTSGGLGRTDSGDKRVIGGVSREFYQRLKKYYDDDANWRQQKKSQYGGYRETDDAIWGFEPRVAEKIYDEMLAEVKVPVLKGLRLDLTDGSVVVKNNRIQSIRMESGEIFTGKMFIDATYEGDLMAKAGVTYFVGREANDTYGETLSGVQKARAVSHQFQRKVDPYVVPGDPKSGVLPRVHAGDPGEDGTADSRIQAYCFRMCLTDDKENMVPYPKPEGYDAKQYEILLRYLTPSWNDIFGNHQPMPNRKTDTNNHGAFGTDNIGMNYDYPEGDYATREKIIKEHEVYQKGLMWFLANDERVPAEVRARVNRWGLAKDEFVDNGNWPHQLYIREARRMVSDYVVNEHDCRRRRIAEDSVGQGSYNMDSHNCQRYITPEGFVRNEGDIQVSPGGPYIISYRSIVPKRGEAENLLVPVCVSSSHIAFGSIRMEPVFMVLGQSAATAAAMAIDEEIAVQDVNYPKLRERLLADKQVLDLPSGTGTGGGGAVSIDPKKLDGVVLDDSDAKREGEWTHGHTVGPFIGEGYLHDGDDGKGERTLTFTTKLPKAGEYEVRLAYSVNPNRATNVPVLVKHIGGEAKVVVNQQTTPAVDKVFAPLGKYKFDAETPAVVVISNAGTNGHVIVDAVQFVPAEK
jgi:hypothetical protein